MPLTRIQSDALKDAITSSNIADGTVATADLASGAVTAPKMAAGAVENYMATGGAPFSLRNKLINGDLKVWQRGTSLTAGGGYQKLYLADRFYIEGSSISGTTYGLTALTYNSLHEDAMQVVPTGTTYLFQGIERGFRDLTAKTVTFSFVATGSGSVGVITWDAANTTVTRATINLSGGSTPTRYSATFTCPSWGGTGQQDLYVGLQLASGVTYKFTQFQLEEGSVATPFERRPFGVELAMCQRYYTKFSWSGSFNRTGSGIVSGSASAQITFPAISMRADPTVSFTSGAQIYDAGTTSTISAVNGANTSGQAIAVDFSTAGGLTAGRGCNVRLNASTDYIAFSAEL